MSRLYIKKLIPASTWISGTKKMLQRNLGYGVGYPKNCGFWDGRILWGDCWCTQPKSIVWSIFSGVPIWENNTVGSNYYLDKQLIGLTPIAEKESSGLPDWGGYPILDGYCDDITFAEMIRDHVEPALIGTPDHMGCYIGEFTLGDGYIYNTHEMTPNQFISPRMASYVDENGYCFDHKGGRYIRTWKRACKMTGIIDYSNGGEIMPTPQPEHPWSIDNVAVYMMRGSIPDGTGVPQGIENRIAFFAEYGYSAEEVQAAQDIVNLVYERNKYDKLACELAMRFIAKEAGDGVTIRQQWVAEHYPDYDTEKLFRKTQDKVNEYLDY